MSLLYPGNRLSQYVLQEAIAALEEGLRLSPQHRRRVCLRMDAGFGTDANLNWVLGQGYQIVAKNNSGRRAGTWGSTIQDWQVVEADHRWVGIPQQQLSFCVPTRTIAVRWRDHQRQVNKHALYVVTDLSLTPLEVCQLYDLRGGAESDIRDDKQGLLLTSRRKRRWWAQEVLVLLNDLAHNFLSMLRREVLAETYLATFGPYRLIEDVFSIPGQAVIEADHLVELRLAADHPHAQIIAETMTRLWR